ncbi:uncharacterized protein LOC131656905 [Vicia villosa]|uniref:uncharacterized protein LOC131656905 n=1 Tax=Vicia villosa TaxID=3911 RepID=UPI00273B549A|nr:uncharacterized protein LOC131656905 [Vicia villosa]
MNPNHHNSWSNFMQNCGIPPIIPNQQNASNNPNSHHNSKFQNPTFIPNQQNYPHFRNYPYYYQHFPSQSNSPTMFHGVQMDNSHVEANDQEPETPQFCTQAQDGLETINLDEEVKTTPVTNMLKIRFQPKEDELLIQSWLNISRDPIVGIDQKGDSFWKRIGEAYNNHRHKNFPDRNPMALKGRWHKKINPCVQKFVGCYKQAVAVKKSGSSESDIVSAACDIYYQDGHEKFTFQSAWKLLRDEPKWLGGSSEPSAKRTKSSASVAYSTSSNPPTPTSEYDPPSPTLLHRPIGNKAAKRKQKEKFVEKPTPKFDAMKEDLNKKIELMSGFARDYARIESEKMEIERKRIDVELHAAKINDLQILTKDTTNMTQRQLQDHEFLCGVIRDRYGIN